MYDVGLNEKATAEDFSDALKLLKEKEKDAFSIDRLNFNKLRKGRIPKAEKSSMF